MNGTHPPAGKTEKAIQNVNIPPVSVTLYPFLQPKQGGYIYMIYLSHGKKKYKEISLF